MSRVFFSSYSWRVLIGVRVFRPGTDLRASLLACLMLESGRCRTVYEICMVWFFISSNENQLPLS